MVVNWKAAVRVGPVQIKIHFSALFMLLIVDILYEINNKMAKIHSLITFVPLNFKPPFNAITIVGHS